VAVAVAFLHDFICALRQIVYFEDSSYSSSLGGLNALYRASSYDDALSTRRRRRRHTGGVGDGSGIGDGTTGCCYVCVAQPRALRLLLLPAGK
jgi:hypothetical protein